MDRKEFLATLGIGAAAIACSYCFGGCKSNDNVTGPPTNVDFTLDLNNAAYAALKNNGGYIYNAGVIVARTSTGSFVAVSQTCTHQGTTVQFDGSQFVCPAHGSIFKTDGSVARGPAGSPLARYNTSLNGNSLRVYS
jgi:cytochrome b6-f complex iron-sulfur subunit